MGLLESNEGGLPRAAKPYPTEYVYVIVNKTTGKLFEYGMYPSRKSAKLLLQHHAALKLAKDYAVRRARLTILHR